MSRRLWLLLNHGYLGSIIQQSLERDNIGQRQLAISVRIVCMRATRAEQSRREALNLRVLKQQRRKEQNPVQSHLNPPALSELALCCMDIGNPGR
eukprot:1138185-Pelagomonas_calceolata.AAC.1